MLDSKFWEKYFKVYDILNIVIPYRELLDLLVREMELSRGEKVLDLGSGTGNLSILISGKGCDVFSIDFAKESLDRHKKKNSDAKTYVHDITKKLPFSDEYFDKVVSNNVIYAIKPDLRDDIIREVFRVLRPGGRVVISNVKSGWKPLFIYKKHIIEDIKKSGFFKVLLKIFILMIPTIKMFYYNHKIKKEGSFGDYGFMGVGEQKNLLSQAGFVDVSKDFSAYADQAIMNSAYKPPSYKK